MTASKTDEGSVADSGAARRQRRKTLPLPNRLPNPGPCFVGRDEEQRQLAAAIRSGAAAGVWGPGGYGKTELVLSVLARFFPERVATTVYLDLPACDGDAMEAEIVRILAMTAGVDDLDWPSLLARRDARLTAILDLAEAENLWVVLDDMHRVDRAAVEALLADLCRYARRSRWLAISREPFQIAAMEGRTLALGAMRQPELDAMARQLRPDVGEDHIAAAVGSAAGSPWRLKNRIAGELGDEDPAEGALAGCTPAHLEFLAGLSVVREPLPAVDIFAFTSELDDADLAGLERRGLLVFANARVRLHDVARPIVIDAVGEERRLALRRRAMASLGESPDPMAALEIIRLAADDRRVETLSRCLDERGAELLAAGHGERLWSYVRTIGAQELETWRLRIAVEAGPAAAREVEPPASARDIDALLWARVLHRRGEMSECADRLASLARRAIGDRPDEVAVEAAILWARSQNNMGNTVEATELLSRVGDTRPELDALRDALLALSRAIIGAEKESLKLLDRLVERRAELRVQTRRLCAQAYYELGRLSDAARLIEVDEGGGAVDYNQNTMLLAAAIAIDRGQMDRVDAWVERAAPMTAGSSPVGLTFQLVDCWRRMITGELTGVEHLLTAIDEQAAAVSYARLRTSVASGFVRLAILRGSPPAALEPALHWPREPSVIGRLLHLDHMEARARQGEAVSLVEIGQAAADRRAIEVAAAAHRVKAVAALAAGDSTRALRELSEALAMLRSSDYHLLRSEVLAVAADANIVAGDHTALADVAAELEDLGRSMSSARLAGDAALLRLAVGDAMEPAELESLAMAFETAPVAARRARHLLGGTPPLDRLDRAVLDALLARPSWRRAETHGDSGPWRAGFGLDERTMTVWTAGRSLSLARRPTLWRLLTTLHALGGSGSKEQLVLDVWDEREYHPLKHDNRLKLAVRKLRRAIEEELDDTEWIATTSDGYALSGVVRIVRAL